MSSFGEYQSAQALESAGEEGVARATYVVEADIPVPPRARTGPKVGAGRNLYPFSRMGVGDSFAFQPDEHEKVASAARKFARRWRVKFSVSYVRRRIWRVA